MKRPFEHYRAEADKRCAHLPPEERDKWAQYHVDHHPGFVTDADYVGSAIAPSPTPTLEPSVASGPGPISTPAAPAVVSKKSRKLRTLDVVLIILIVILYFVVFTGRAHAQAGRGNNSTTVTNQGNGHIGLDVNIVGGGGTGGGPADSGLSTAASETDATRQKVTSALRLWDQSQVAGVQLVGWRGDTTSGAWVNCKSGCAAAGDTTGTPTALNALNAAASAALSGEQSASFQLLSGNTLVGTLTPEVSFDGGSTWIAGLIRLDLSGVWLSAVGASSTTATYHIMVPGGASNVRVRVSAFTSGTATVTVRTVAQPESLLAWQGISGSILPPYIGIVGGSDGTNSRAFHTDGSGNLNIIFAAPQHTICDSGCASGGSSTPADAFANPSTAGMEMSFPMVWNGLTWDRLYGDKTNGAFVQLKAAIPAGSAIIGKVGIDQTTPGTTNGVAINAALPAGANVIGHVITDSGSTTAVTGNVTVIQPTAANLNMTCANCSSSGASLADEGTFTQGSTPFAPIGGYFNSAITNLTSGQGGAAQMTNTRHLLIDIASQSLGKVLATIDPITFASPQAVTVATWAGGTLGAMANYGTSPGAVLVPGVNAFITNTPNVNIQTNAAVNVAQINGVTPSVGNGVTDTGTQRVTLSSDSTGQVKTTNFPTTVDTNSGAAGASTIRVAVANTDPCGPGNAKSYAFYDAATNGATQLVPLSSSKIIYVCSYSFSSSSSTANTLKLVYGTGANCATGQTPITPGIVLQAAASQGPIGKVMPNSAGLATIASNALCLLTNAAQTAQAEVSYVQQ